MITSNLSLDLGEIERSYKENPLNYFSNKRLCLFKACLEKYFPGVRWGIQDLLEELNLKVSVCTNQSCCSGTFFQRNLVTRAQFAAINERNVYELNQQADFVLFSCNGCYNSLLRGREFLKNQEVNLKTKKILKGLEKKKGISNPDKFQIFKEPNVRFIHDLDFLHLIRNDVLNSLKFDLKNLKVAIHYGCHYLNLSRDKRTVDGYLKDKTKLEDLVQLFGGNPVDYQEKEGCCGWGASQLLINPREALKITYNKLKSAENVDADFLLMPCPTCLYTLSKPEYREKINKLFKEKLDIPTIQLNELIAMLRGCEEERCITLRRKTPRLDEIFEIITKE
ncbi:MAG: heterodisulfide reductase-related iron-sulfur binding cluster [Promethearchaeota archaeon]|jgi:heterodisulfide reductase subunit B